MIDQLVIGDMASYDDFSASVKERKIHAPEKKIIKDTVPFSNQTYDFSAINGEVYWNERMLEYVFEILADSPEELEAKKQKFFSWVMNVMEEKVHDPFIQNYHFVGTYNSLDVDDSEIEKSTITVTFTAYPYMIANEAKRVSIAVHANTRYDFVVENNSSHRTIGKIDVSGGPMTVIFKGEMLEVHSVSPLEIMLEVGENDMSVIGASNNMYAFWLTYIEEVL